MTALGLKDTYIGAGAQVLRGILDMSNPIRNGVVNSWDDLEVNFHLLFDMSFSYRQGYQGEIFCQRGIFHPNKYSI